MKGEVVKADSGSSRRPHRRGVKVLEWICSYTHALTAGGPPPSIINPSGTCSLSQESAPAACETNRGMRSKYGRGTHLEQPHVRVRDFCQHIPHVDQFKVATADLRASTRGSVSQSRFRRESTTRGERVAAAPGGRLWVFVRSRLLHSPVERMSGSVGGVEAFENRSGGEEGRTRMSDTPATTRTSPSSLIISASAVTPARALPRGQSRASSVVGERDGGAALEGCWPSKTARIGSPFLGKSGSSYLTEGCWERSIMVGCWRGRWVGSDRARERERAGEARVGLSEFD